MSGWRICRSSSIEAQPTRRERIRERRLLTQEESSYQNVVLIETEQDAEVELHEVGNSESLFVLDGQYEVISSDAAEPLHPGDLVYFPPQTSHGLRCVKGPGRFLAIFAPGRLETTYVEAWKQYSHEDNLSQSRNGLFWGGRQP